MSDLLVAIILAVCPASLDGGTTLCMENIYNCAVEMKTLVTKESIERCISKQDIKGEE